MVASEIVSPLFFYEIPLWAHEFIYLFIFVTITVVFLFGDQIVPSLDSRTLFKLAPMS